MKTMLDIKGCSVCIPCERVKLLYQTESSLYSIAIRNFNLNFLNEWWGVVHAMSLLGLIDCTDQEAKRYEEAKEIICKFNGVLEED